MGGRCGDHPWYLHAQSRTLTLLLRLMQCYWPALRLLKHRVGPATCFNSIVDFSSTSINIVYLCNASRTSYLLRNTRASNSIECITGQHNKRSVQRCPRLHHQDVDVRVAGWASVICALGYFAVMARKCRLLPIEYALWKNRGLDKGLLSTAEVAC